MIRSRRRGLDGSVRVRQVLVFFTVVRFIEYNLLQVDGYDFNGLYIPFQRIADQEAD